MSKTTLPSIGQIQEEIIVEFQSLEGDREQMLTYIMEIGDKLPPMPLHLKTERNMIEGCLSKVWLTYKKKDGCLFFEADSNTVITKGLISLLLRILSGQKIKTIVNANLFFVQRIGLTQLLGAQRSGGFANMVKTIKLVAIQQSEGSSNL